MKCKHKDYKAKRRPRGNCEACWRKYIKKHPIEKSVPWIDENNLLLPKSREGFSWFPSRDVEWW